MHDRVWQRRPATSGRYRTWLRDSGSLTARITGRCRRFRVAVVFQGLRRPNRDEHFLFRDRRRVVVREVLLVCGETPVVFAHTIADPRRLRGTWRRLSTLGAKPLGAALFADARIVRCALRHRRIGAHHELYRRVRELVPDTPAQLWARRSIFQLNNSPILVTEIFLPEVLAL